MQVPKLQTVFWSAVVLLFAKVFASILIGYADYFPPKFSEGFLVGRRQYFFGIYQYAFYAHLIFGPLALFIGTVLVASGRNWINFKLINHRKLGKIQAALVLFGVVPSGIIMALPLFIGVRAGGGLMVLAIATGIFMMIAVVKATQRDFSAHQVWATRCYILLLSPLILRIVNGTLLVTGLQTDLLLDLNNWITWMIPLAIYELRLHQTASIVNQSNQTLKGAI